MSANQIDRVKAQRHETEAAVVRELIEAGYEEAVCQLHARNQRGELTFRAVAAELGLHIPPNLVVGRCRRTPIAA